MAISGRTSVYGILGYPVGHTLSPVMYNALFQQIELDAVYVPMEVHPAKLCEAVQALLALGVRGVHLTCPHKEEVIPLLHDVSDEARTIGAVNVVVNRSGVLYGDNTDGAGYLDSLRSETRCQPEGAEIALIGAGGAARAIAFTLAQVGARRIFVLNRTQERAGQVCAELGRNFPHVMFEALPLTPQAFRAIAPTLSLVTNAARGAASGTLGAFPMSVLPAHCVVSDINYYATRSPLLVNAEMNGLTVHPGLGMLLQQGARSLRLLNLDIGAATLQRCLEQVEPRPSQPQGDRRQ